MNVNSEMAKRMPVVTGMGCISSLGNSFDEMFMALQDNCCSIKIMEEWKFCNGLNTLLAAPCANLDESSLDRKKRRSMSRMSIMAYLATKQAIDQANINLGSYDVHSHTYPIEKLSLIMGSTTGSPQTLHEFFGKFIELGGPKGQLSTSFFKVMNHSIPANVGLAFDYLGPMLSPSSACSTSLQALALGSELIRSGIYDCVIVGGADELHVVTASVFDVVKATSVNYNTNPQDLPGPFDAKRDGLVVSEGASIMVLESYEHCLKRQGKPLAVVHGAKYICDGTHMSRPQEHSMTLCMEQALKDSPLITKSDIQYVNAHATGTQVGDLNEGKAIVKLLGNKVPISSLKGHMGHSLAACGLQEVGACIKMMEKSCLIPTYHLNQVDEGLTSGHFIKDQISQKCDFFLTNNFAFGGMNCSAILSSFEAFLNLI